MKKWLIALSCFVLLAITLLLSAMTASNQTYAQSSISAPHTTVPFYGSSTPPPTPTTTQQHALPAATMTVASQMIEQRDQNNTNPNSGETTISQPQRIVIYTANLRIVADQPDVVIEQVGLLAEDLGGWIVNSNTSERGNNQKYGTINVRVPANQLDYTVNTIKSYAVTVTSEVISGDDVTNQYIDMASRLKNLQSSEEQLQAILETAVDVDGVLATFRELSRIRGDIEAIQGQLSYYDESSMFSSVTVSVDPLLPTPAPYIAPEWNPSHTVDRALDELKVTTQQAIDNLIRLIIVGGPFALIVLILTAIGLRIGWTIWKRAR